MLSLSQTTKSEVIKTFNFTSRYLDDLLTIDKIVNQIITSEIQLNMNKVSDTEAVFVSDGSLRLKFTINEMILI